MQKTFNGALLIALVTVVSAAAQQSFSDVTGLPLYAGRPVKLTGESKGNVVPSQEVP